MKYYVKAIPRHTSNKERKLVVFSIKYTEYPAVLHNGTHYVLMVTDNPTLFSSKLDANNAIKNIDWVGSPMDYEIIEV